MKRVRYAPSPTGSLHVGNALTAVANRNAGDWLLLRIDDTDPERNVPGGEAGVEEDLRWLGIAWDEGPVSQSKRNARYVEAWESTGLPPELQGFRLVRENGTATYNLASVVDDVDFGITHVIRGADHRPNEPVQRKLFEALGTSVPEFIYVGLLVGDDGKKLSKRAEGATVASLRDAGYPAEAVRAYLDELGLPRHDVHLDLERIRSLSVDVLAAMEDDELAARAGVPVAAVPLMRGAHDLVEARALAASVLDAPTGEHIDPLTLARFVELRSGAPETVGKDQAREIIRELKAVGGNLKALRVALTGAERGPELWAVVAALPRDEALRRALP